MKMKFERGKDVGKTKQLQLLCKQWFMAAKDSDGNVAKNIVWDEAMFDQSCWHNREESITEEESFLTWGQVIGECFGKKNAKAAVSRGH